ncbi:MAG: hypothetical protein WDO16_15305 [Bacteroidota bacterium]
MKKTVMLAATIISFFSAKAQTKDYAAYPVYTGTDLGLTYSARQSAFRIWSPPADNAQLLIYKTGAGEETPADHCNEKKH